MGLIKHGIQIILDNMGVRSMVIRLGDGGLDRKGCFHPGGSISCLQPGWKYCGSSLNEAQPVQV